MYEQILKLTNQLLIFQQIISIGAVILAILSTIEAQPMILIPLNDVYNYHPLRIQRSIPREPEVDASSRIQRQAGGHHDVVDFGAHTGHHGAFGWYADYPVNSHE